MEQGGDTKYTFEHRDFVESGRFDLYPGFAAQFRVAKALTSLLDPARLTPDSFRNVLAPLGMAQIISPDEAEVAQEPLVRDATARFVSILALLVAGGDVRQAEVLIGGSQYCDLSTELVNKVHKLMRR
jgi:hypothetical protein